MTNRLTQRILFSGGLLVLALPGIRTISHSEFWMHLASGRWIAQNGIMRTDPFTFVMADTAWINTTWLYDLLLYGTWQMGGATLVTVLHVAAVLAAFALLIPVARRWAGTVAIVFALIMSAWLLAPRFEVRPMTLALIFPALFLLMLSGGFRPLVLFPVLLGAQLLWTNMHGSFLLGPFFCLIVLVQAYSQAKGGLFESGTLTPEHRSMLYRLGGLTVATLLVSLVNPYFLALHREVVHELLNPTVREWISPFSGQFLSQFSRRMVALALLVGAGGLLTQKQKLPIALTTIAVLSAFLVVRSTPAFIDLFALLAFPFFCLSLESIGVYLGSVLFKSTAVREHLRNGLVIVLVLLTLVSVVGIAGNRYYVHTGSVSSFGWGTVTELFPEAAAPIIEHPEFPVRVFNLPVDGGYLAWRFPERKSYIDQRTSLFDFSFYASLAEGLSGRTEHLNALVQDWDPGAVIINGSWPNAAQAIRHLRGQDRWDLLYFDGATAIFLLNVSPNAALLRDRETYLREGLQRIENDRRQYQARLGGFRLPPIPARLIGAGHVFHHHHRYPEAGALYELLAVGAPRMVTARVHLGACHVQEGHFVEAIRVLEPALRSLPRDSSLAAAAHLNIGISRLQLEDYGNALRHLQQATDIQPENASAWLWMGRVLHEYGRTHDAESAFRRARQIDPSIRMGE